MKTFLFSLAVIFTLSACNWCDDTPTPTTDCDETCIIDTDLYDNDTGDVTYILSASIEDDCMSITYSTSGCDSDDWIVNLYDSGNANYSLPPQRDLRLDIGENGACLAIFTKTTSFDISHLQIEEHSSLLLNLKGLEEAIPYNY